MSADNKVQVDMTEDEARTVMSALDYFAKSLKKGLVEPEVFVEGEEGRLQKVIRANRIEDVMKLSDRLSEGLSGRGGKGFGIFKLGNVVVTEQERRLLIFSLKFLVAGDDLARRKLRWSETKEWDRDLVAQLEEKLNGLQ